MFTKYKHVHILNIEISILGSYAATAWRWPPVLGSYISLCHHAFNLVTIGNQSLPIVGSVQFIMQYLAMGTSYVI